MEFGPETWEAMLPPMRSPKPSFGASGRHLCAGCEQETDGIPVGGYCAACTRRRERRARQLSRWIAAGTTIPLAAYVAWTLPPIAHLRLIMLVGVLLWYVAVRRIAKGVVLQWIR